MKNILTSISLEKTVQSSLHLDGEKSKKKRQKLTIEAVRQHIESFGYKLISTEYVKALDKLKIICPNQHRYLASYNSFQQGQRCPECAGNKTHTIEAVRQHIESFGYKLISIQYVSAHAKLDTSCPAEHLYKVSYANFQRGTRCAECNGNAKYRLSNVKAYIESFGYRLRSTAYLGANAKLDLVCPNQHMYRASFHVFQQGYRCAECAGLKKHTIDKVRQHIESFKGYRLLSTEYVNANAKLNILCPKSHTYFATYKHFQKGVRCPECFYISQRRTMLNGEEWEPYLRRSKDEQAWRKSILKRDARTCQACFYPSKNLCAHHIESFARNPELRNDLTNGVTLCKSCHIELHSKYGQTTATREDLAEFTRLKCR